MKRKLLLAVASVFLLAAPATYAQVVVVRTAPPAAIVETRPARPGAGYVWTPGYHRWDGNRYVWVGGTWVQPPHPGAHWIAHRWVRRNGGWVLVEGHWR